MPFCLQGIPSSIEKSLTEPHYEGYSRLFYRGVVTAMDFSDSSLNVNILRMEQEMDITGLLRALKSDEWADRRQAAQALGLLKDPMALEHLIFASRDENFRVKRIAIAALGQIGGDEAVKALRDIIKQGNPSEQKWAEEALREAGHDRETQQLTNPVSKEISHVKPVMPDTAPNDIIMSPELHEETKRLVEIMKYHDFETGKRALKTLESLGWKPRNDEEKAFRFILRNEWPQLIALGSKAVFPLLRKLREKDLDLRCGIIYCLGEIKDQRAIVPLIELLDGERNENYMQAMEEEGRAGYTAVLALGKIGDPGGIRPVIAWLRAFLLNRCDPELQFTLQRLFGGYTDIILGLFRRDGGAEAVLKRSGEAMNRLRRIETMAANNLLYEILNRRDFEIDIAMSSCTIKMKKTLDFDPIRQAAREELQRRGNPGYNPVGYQFAKAWKTL